MKTMATFYSRSVSLPLVVTVLRESTTSCWRVIWYYFRTYSSSIQLMHRKIKLAYRDVLLLTQVSLWMEILYNFTNLEVCSYWCSEINWTQTRTGKIRNLSLGLCLHPFQFTGHNQGFLDGFMETKEIL